MTAIQEKIKYKLQEQNMSARSCALVAGIPESSLKNIIQGKVSHPRVDTLTALARALKCPLRDLMPDEQEDGSSEPTLPIDDALNPEMLLKSYSDVVREANALNIRLSKAAAIKLTEKVYDYLMQLSCDGHNQSTASSFIHWLLKSEKN